MTGTISEAISIFRGEPDTLNLFTVQGNIGKNNYNSYNITNMRLENIDRVRQWQP